MQNINVRDFAQTLAALQNLQFSLNKKQTWSPLNMAHLWA